MVGLSVIFSFTYIDLAVSQLPGIANSVLLKLIPGVWVSCVPLPDEHGLLDSIRYSVLLAISCSIGSLLARRVVDQSGLLSHPDLRWIQEDSAAKENVRVSAVCVSVFGMIFIQSEAARIRNAWTAPS
jgi:hypothetical protein